jgi:adenylate cyclase
VAAFAENQTPPVRVGLATGEMVSVFGDLYGPDVNLAARLVAVAEPDTVVVSQRTRDGAPDFGFDALPARPLKGFPDPITSYNSSRRMAPARRCGYRHRGQRRDSRRTVTKRGKSRLPQPSTQERNHR